MNWNDVPKTLKRDIELSTKKEENMAEYMKELRKRVGSIPLMMCAGSMIVYDEKKGVLLQNRKDNGLWGYHGGAVELGESVEAAAKRELFEETGLIATEFSLFEVYSGEDLYYKYSNGDEVFIIDLVFVCTQFEGKLHEQNEEVNELKWFSLDEVPSNLSPPIVRPLTDFINHIEKEMG